MYLCGECGNLLGQHLLLLPRQPVDLVRLDPLRHQLEVRVILIVKQFCETSIFKIVVSSL